MIVHARGNQRIAQRRARVSIQNREGVEITFAGFDRCVLVAVFRRCKPKQLVLLDRAANRAAELLAVKGCRRQSVRKRARLRVQVPVAFVVENRTVILVGAAFGHNINDAGSGTARFGRELRRRNLKFRDGILREVGERSADYVVVVVAAVHGDVAAAADATVRADFQRVRLGGVEIRRRAVAGHEVRQFQKVSAVQRNGFDGGGGDLPLNHGLGHFHGVRCARNRDAGSHGRDFYFRVFRGGAARLHNYAFVLRRCKSRSLDRNRVRSRGHIRQHVKAVGVGSRFARHVRRVIYDRNLGARYHRAAWIRHSSVDRARRRLRLRRNGSQEKNYCINPPVKCTPLHLHAPRHLFGEMVI